MREVDLIGGQATFGGWRAGRQTPPEEGELITNDITLVGGQVAGVILPLGLVLKVGPMILRKRKGTWFERTSKPLASEALANERAGGPLTTGRWISHHYPRATARSPSCASAGCASQGYEWTQHHRIGLQSGLNAEEIERIKTGAGADGWSAAEKALLAACDGLNRDHFISNPSWAELAKHYSERQCMDLVFTVAQYTQVSMILNSFGIQVEEGQNVDPDLKGP